MEISNKISTHRKASLSNPLQNSYADFLNNELKNLQDKIVSLECRMSTRIIPIKLTKTRPRSIPTTKSRKKCEKELETLESSCGLRSDSRSAMSDCENSKKLSQKLVKLRQKNAGFIKDNEKLKKELKTKKTLEEKEKTLKDDFKTLKTTIKRSENIRKKQKAVIDELKSKLEQIQPTKNTKKKHKRKKSSGH